MGHYYHGIENGESRPYDRPDGMEIPHGSQGPMLVEGAVVTHNLGDGIDCSVQDTTIRRCYVANNGCDGVKLWRGNSRIENTLIYGRGGGDATPTPWAAIVIDTDTAADRFTLMNVTVDDSLGHNYVMYAMYDHPTLPVSLTIKNCIFRATGPESPIFTTGATNLVADYNLFYIPNSNYVISHGDMEYASTQLTGLGSGNLYGDPKFVRPAWGSTGDYHLKPDSPAINSGSNSDGLTGDLENNPRDTHPDMGAYEYGDCVPVSPELSLNIPCATYLGNHYSFGLAYYPNAMDPSNLYWKMGPTTLGAANTTGPCVNVTSNLTLEITCARLAGFRYGFDLEYYPNPGDTSSLYWKMNSSSLVAK